MENEANYRIAIKTTADKCAATTKADVFIQLVGEDGCTTEWIKLTRFWRRFFRQGNLDIFDITTKGVGMPLIARLKIDNNGDENEVWGCDYVTIEYKGETEEFPVYDWITNTVDVAQGKATLPQNVENKHVLDSRSSEKNQTESLYKWASKDDLDEKNWHQARYMETQEYETLPPMFKYYDEFMNDTRGRLKAIRMNGLIQKIKGFFGSMREIDDYNSLHQRLGSDFPTFHEKWNEDSEFARQMLNGNNRLIKRCKGVPPYCKFTDEHVAGLLADGKTLDEEIVKGRVYIVDFVPLTHNLTRSDQYGKGQLYCADATALFYSHPNGFFLPIAIQLQQSNEESIFTPNDKKYDWLLAKIYFRCADYNVSEWVSHFTTHTAMEPIVVALFRCLPRSHPVYKLLRPHARLVIAANQRGRDFFFLREVAGIYRSQDAVEQTNRGYSNFDFADLYFPKKLEKKGLMDSVLLPNYHFRDDALLYWDVIEKFVGKVLGHYYTSDDDVRDDFEIQNWINEIYVEGFTYRKEMSTNCPQHFETVKELESFITMVIFTTSVYHASVHFPQYQIYKFIPNAPGGMRLPIHKRGEGSLQRILDSLPNVEMSVLQLGVSYVATRFDEQEVLLGQYPMRLFTEPEIAAFMDEFSADIKEVGKKIEERNKKRDTPYGYLLPERIPATITS